MSTFTLAISCLTTSNLPWFMDLTFQVPMQYWSLQHQTLLLSPITSTTGYCFCFGSIPSFFLEFFLHWYPVAHWVPTNLGSFIFQCPIFLPFHTVHGVLQARILKYYWILKNTEPDLRLSLLQRYEWPAAGAGALGAVPWSHSLWHKPCWSRSPLTPP